MAPSTVNQWWMQLIILNAYGVWQLHMRMSYVFSGSLLLPFVVVTSTGNPTGLSSICCSLMWVWRKRWERLCRIYVLIYLTSIMYTYKVSRKLQKIYHFFKKASKCYGDKTICSREHIHIADFIFPPLLQRFTVMDMKRYHTSVPRKARI